MKVRWTDKADFFGNLSLMQQRRGSLSRFPIKSTFQNIHDYIAKDSRFYAFLLVLKLRWERGL